MAGATRSDIHRLDRVASIRQTLSNVAEAHVREAEAQVRDIVLQEERIARTIYDTRAEVAQRGSLVAYRIQQNENYIETLKQQRKIVLQTLDNAKRNVESKRQQWVEARREQKIIERLQERRLQECRREEDVAQQKAVDEAFIGRIVHTRIHG